MTRLMLDTNTASYLVRNRYPSLNRRFDQNTEIVCVSCLTEAELLFGLANQPGATTIAASVTTFLRGIESLPWDSAAASAYASLKNQLRQNSLTLAPIDLLIAAHSLAANAILVTSDQAFYKASHLLRLENWSNT